MSTNLLAQETEARLLTAVLPHIAHRTFADVGAEQGAFARLLASQGLTGVIFEPLPNHQSALAALAAELPIRHLPCAVDQQDGRAEFHIACDEKGEPLNYFHSLQKLEGDAQVRHTKTIPVQCRSLASLHAEGVIDRELGVLKIDTEGNDLRVLRGLGPVRAEVVTCEFFTPGTYSGWKEAAPAGLIAQAQQLGYSSWVAVRRRGAAELVTLNSIEFMDHEWGNLIFFADRIFAAARQVIGHAIAESELRIFTQLEEAAKPRRRRWFGR